MLFALLCLLTSSCLFLVSFILRPRKWKRHVPPKSRLTFNGRHVVISQKIDVFITKILFAFFSMLHKGRKSILQYSAANTCFATCKLGVHQACVQYEQSEVAREVILSEASYCNGRSTHCFMLTVPLLQDDFRSLIYYFVLLPERFDYNSHLPVLKRHANILQSVARMY
jgi:hypothetical protein